MPAQDQVADADVSGVMSMEVEDSETETTITENVPDVAIDEDRVSARLPAEIPFVRVSVPGVLLADQLANVHPKKLLRETVGLLDDDADGLRAAVQNTGYVRVLHEPLPLKKVWTFVTTCCSVPSPKIK